MLSAAVSLQLGLNDSLVQPMVDFDGVKRQNLFGLDFQCKVIQSVSLHSELRCVGIQCMTVYLYVGSR